MLCSQIDDNNQNKFAESAEGYKRLGCHVIRSGGIGEQLASWKSESKSCSNLESTIFFVFVFVF